MANYQNLKAAISAAIRTNGNQEITGQKLQNVLNSIVSVIGANYTFAGVATPATNPGTPDQNVFYIATQGGTYTNFGATALPEGISLLMWNGSWTAKTIMYNDGGVFDISVYKSTGGTLAKFADLGAALGTNGANIPAAARKGGMSVKFVQSSDNKYVQYRLMSDTFNTTPANWQGVDDEPTAGSNNLVKSGGLISSGGVHFYVTGNGTNIVIKEIRGLIVGRKYVLTAPKWSVSEIGNTQNVIQLAWYDGSETYLVKQITKENLPDNLYIEFTAMQQNYYMNFRGDTGTQAQFKIKEYDGNEEIDESIKELQKQEILIGYDFSISGNDGTIVQGYIPKRFVVGKKYRLYADFWKSSYKDIEAIIFQLYHSDSVVVGRFFNGENAPFVFDFVAEAEVYNYHFYADSGDTVNFHVCEYNPEFNYLENDRYVVARNIYVNGNGQTVVQKSISGLTVGKTYVLYADKWAMDELQDSQNALILYYDMDGSAHTIKSVPKSSFGDYQAILFDAVTTAYIIYVRADSGKTAFIQLLEANNDFDHFEKGLDKKFEEQTNSLSSEITALKSYWSGKTIAWYGTSIPAGGYPQIIGGILGCGIVNRARGSSFAAKANHYYEAWQVSMGHTIQEKIAFVNDTWTIDDVNHTFTNGPRTMSVSGIPNLTTYDEVVAARKYIISASYEVIILANTLLSDPTEHTAFLQDALGDLYSYMMTNHADVFAYHDTDLWVLDHGHNDNCSTNPSELNMASTDITTFVGAMNFYIGLISQYKPHARICMVSDYDDFNNAEKRYTIETQQAIAERWHLPFIPIHKYLPWNINTKVRTRGYWDASAVWHDKGYEWGALNGEMIGNGHFPPYIIYKFDEPGRPARTISELEELLNPTEDAAGNWWYDFEPRYIWLFDGLHPHSVAGGRALKMYAEPLAELLKEIGTNGY